MANPGLLLPSRKMKEFATRCGSNENPALVSAGSSNGDYIEWIGLPGGLGTSGSDIDRSAARNCQDDRYAGSRSSVQGRMIRLHLSCL